jgi:hypothetical protein
LALCFHSGVCLFVEPAKIDILAGQKNHAPVKVRHTTFRFSTGKVTIYKFIRKTQKIPLKEIAKAEEIKKVYLNSKK